jgi:hypothetical protein
VPSFHLESCSDVGPRLIVYTGLVRGVDACLVARLLYTHTHKGIIIIIIIIIIIVVQRSIRHEGMEEGGGIDPPRGTQIPRD